MINTILTVIDKTSGSASVVNETSSAGGFAGLGMIGTMLYIFFLIGIFYFFALKPQKKREEEIKTLQSNLVIDDYVILDSGIYGKIKDITDEVIIVELGMNKNILVPVVKTRIIGKGEPNLTTTKK